MPVGWRPFRAWGCNGGGQPGLAGRAFTFCPCRAAGGGEGQRRGGEPQARWGTKGVPGLRQVGSLMGAREKVGGERRVGSGVRCFLDEPCHARGVAPIQGLGMYWGVSNPGLAGRAFTSCPYRAPGGGGGKARVIFSCSRAVNLPLGRRLALAFRRGGSSLRRITGAYL